MLENLSSRLSRVIKTMRGQARLTEENTREMLREVRLALLDADVALPVVRELVSRIKQKALGEEVIANLNPGQALVGVVERELTQIIGGDLPAQEREINLSNDKRRQACQMAHRKSRQEGSHRLGRRLSTSSH